MTEHSANTLLWSEWQQITRRMYLQTIAGWPRSEMYAYWQRGLSPQAAYDLAASRRIVGKRIAK